MTITVNTAASVKEMTLLNTVKDELGITSDTDDAILANFIKRATALIETYTGRKFARETVTETLPSYGGNKLLLSRRPVVSITYVKLDGSTQSSTSYTIDDADAGILWKDAGWTPTSINNHFINAIPTGQARREWEIKYVAGYIMPGSTEGESTLPSDLEYAACQIVKSWYISRYDNDNIISQRVGDASETRMSSGDTLGIPPVALSILSYWRVSDITN